MSKKPVQVPGDEKAPLITELNNANDDPNKIARDRERHLAGVAMATTGGEGDLAPPPALDAGPAISTRVIDGKRVRVSIPPVNRNPDVLRYGREQQLPAGTPVNKDGTVCAGSDEPYGVIGSVLTDKGWLVGRIIPLADEEPEPTSSKRKAA